MKAQLRIMMIVCSGLCLSAIDCKREPAAFPLSLQTVRQLNPANTTQISFEERGGEIFVSVTDKHGDRHIHRLNYEGVSKREALDLLKQKMSELEIRQ